MGVWLSLDERLVNDRFVEVLADRAGWDSVPSVNPWIPIVAVGVVEVWDTVEAYLGARRSAVVGRSEAPVPAR